MKVYGEIPYQVIVDAVTKGFERQESADSLQATFKRKLSQAKLTERFLDNRGYGLRATYKAQKRTSQQQARPSLREDAKQLEAEDGSESESDESVDVFEDSEEEASQEFDEDASESQSESFKSEEEEAV